jgi:hypothetical protein
MGPWLSWTGRSAACLSLGLQAKLQFPNSRCFMFTLAWQPLLPMLSGPDIYISTYRRLKGCLHKQ